ncbi:MAG: ABC transporter ATP-binding protein, partial [Microbacteriaceae bacterium]|nr:ABC transporter ATP-binding protein [Microbacteriaceae bacterium]
TDMLAQRGSGFAPASRSPAKAKSKPAAPPSPPAARRRRLTFNDKHALETLPKTIAALETESRALQQQLDDPGLFARDRAGYEAAAAALGAVQAKLSEAEDRWLELEILREELSGEQ